MKKQINVIAKLFIAVAISANLTSCDNKETPAPDAKPTIKIGVNLPLTGDMADMGIKARKGAILALEEQKNKKILKNNYELIFENDMLEMSKVANITNKFVNIDKVDVLVSILGGRLIAPIAEKHKIPHFTLTAEPKIATDYDYSFVHWPQPKDYAEIVIKHFKSKGIKRITILGFHGDGFVAIEKAFIKEAKEKGVEVSDIQYFSPQEKHFKIILEKQKQLNPDVYVVAAHPPAIYLITRDARILGIKDKLFGIEAFNYVDNMSIFNENKFATADQGNDVFLKKFEAKHGEKIGHGTKYVYDIINIIIEGFENKDDTQFLHDYISEKEFNFSNPIYISKSNIIESSPVIKQIKNGKAVLVEEK